MSTAPKDPDPQRRGGPDDAEAVTDALLTASRALVAVAVRSLTAVDADVTLVQLRALVVLASRGPQTVGALAEALGVHPSTLTRLADRLVAKGFVDREPSRESRREVTITLLPAGTAIVAGVTRARRAEIGRIVARVPRPHRASLVAALTEFAAAAGEVPEQAWSSGWW